LLSYQYNFGICSFIKNHLVDLDNIIVDSKSGVTGAGKSLSLALHFAECNETMKAYKIVGHNHIPEVEQELSNLYFGNEQKEKKENIKISFTPHLIPINRGILSTGYLNLKDDEIDEGEIFKIYQEFYQNAPFVRIFKSPNLPEIKYVVGTNYCDIGFAVDKRTGKVKVISAIDNLIKGAAGQAVENMNIMFDFSETEGINF
jgi:Acetylglutamate semialdehyde dehydrogenase